MKSCSGEQKCSATGDFSNRLCFQSSRVAVHPLVYMITGFTTTLFSTLGACYKVDNIGRLIQLVLHLSLMVAPDADFAICVWVIILLVLHLALPHGRDSQNGLSSHIKKKQQKQKQKQKKKKKNTHTHTSGSRDLQLYQLM